MRNGYSQVGVCYRDSPCNEQGTDGGNKNGCSLTEVSFGQNYRYEHL